MTQPETNTLQLTPETVSCDLFRGLNDNEREQVIALLTRQQEMSKLLQTQKFDDEELQELDKQIKHDAFEIEKLISPYRDQLANTAIN